MARTSRILSSTLALALIALAPRSQVRAREAQASGAAEREGAPSNGSAESAKCSSDPALMSKARPDDSKTLSFERAILGRYQRRVEEKSSLSAPLAVGIAFDGLQIGAPRNNERTLDRVDGSYIRSAPVGGSIFPVKTRFTVCELYRREVTWTSVDGRYECFKDNFGEWACGNASGWRTLDTKRELLEGR